MSWNENDTSQGSRSTKSVIFRFRLIFRLIFRFRKVTKSIFAWGSSSPSRSVSQSSPEATAAGEPPASTGPSRGSSQWSHEAKAVSRYTYNIGVDIVHLRLPVKGVQVNIVHLCVKICAMQFRSWKTMVTALTETSSQECVGCAPWGVGCGQDNRDATLGDRIC